MNNEPRQVDVRPTKIRQALRWTVQALALFGVWFAFSGHTEIEFLVMGAVAAVAGTALTHWLFAGDRESRFSHTPYPLGWFIHGFYRSAFYAPWLLWEIAISNLHVAYLVLHPRLPVEPSLVEFETSLHSETAQVLLAQSITLTTGHGDGGRLGREVHGALSLRQEQAGYGGRKHPAQGGRDIP